MAFEILFRLPTRIKQGEVVEAKLRIRHPVRTGLRLVEEATTKFERFARDQPAVYVKTVEIFYGEERISFFELNSSLSDDPILGFKFRADRAAPLKAVAVDYQGDRSETSTPVEFSA